MSTQDNTATIFTTMQHLLATSAVELFGAYGVRMEELPQGPEDPAATDGSSDIAAIIGFAGARMRGSLVLTTTIAAVARWREAIDASPGDARDTAGEFANMLLGRFKGHLLAEGWPILMTTPTTAVGRDLAITHTEGESTVWLGFQAEGWRLHVLLDVAFDGAFASEAPEASQESVAAGEMIMF
jgi:CheY-specific phosphatase CheX